MVKRNKVELCIIIILMFILPAQTYAMHIMEGFLPLHWAIIWWVALIPFLFISTKKLQKSIQESPDNKMLLAMVGAFIFVVSALKLPSVTGSSSHATGVGLGAILFGPYVMVVISFVVLVFQALLLAHGGITTLGANGFAMGVVGPVLAYGLYKGLKRIGLSNGGSIFIAAAIGNMSTYVVTAAQLAIAHQDPITGFYGAFLKFLGVFSLTQIPLAITEGLLTVVVINILLSYRDKGLVEIPNIKGGYQQ
ncbi:energy-coupling factor ABC transporter permease [Alkaliphilus peptidifermentans]|uniref:Cobalt transport protein CbiM n=1 Tax=Alkaliphilus peptidifermentans DSM 18978 TaxID=1120976 RepID=A0A1G5ARI0_9FIRM|nr:energy-coupling factor ABC transporter permease [Alkaliphilus peptidifermentans]SCX80482.1 cobalt/nickel transport system permease protein [Alkaliphilus peptidifermentans DSM 18978]